MIKTHTYQSEKFYQSYCQSIWDEPLTPSDIRKLEDVCDIAEDWLITSTTMSIHDKDAVESISEPSRAIYGGDPRTNSCMCGWRGDRKRTSCPLCYNSFVE